MDELFFLPPSQVAMPRAYWQLPDTKQLSSLLIVLEPSFKEWYALMDSAHAITYGQVESNVSSRVKYDMELMNERYGDSALVLPHRQYGLVTGEFRKDDHRAFLGNEYEEWDPEKVLAEAKLVHFSDWPLPKPWVMWPQELIADMLPKCKVKPGTVHESGCKDREIWKKLYDDFRRRRRVCFPPRCIASILTVAGRVQTAQLPGPELASAGETQRSSGRSSIDPRDPRVPSQ